jgi:hypothetical protein
MAAKDLLEHPEYVGMGSAVYSACSVKDLG